MKLGLIAMSGVRAWELCTLFDVNFQPARMCVAELEAGLRSLGSRVYSDEFTRERRTAFKRNYLAKHRTVTEHAS